MKISQLCTVETHLAAKPYWGPKKRVAKSCLFYSGEQSYLNNTDIRSPKYPFKVWTIFEYISNELLAFRYCTVKIISASHAVFVQVVAKTTSKNKTHLLLGSV